jgi:hypothetical protein
MASSTSPVNALLRIYSPYTPQECAKRLSVTIASKRGSPSASVVGRVDESSMRLSKRISYNNSFQTFLTATMHPEGSGTVIEGKFTMSAYTRIFMSVWFGGIVLFGGIHFFISVQHHTLPPILTGPPGMLLFAFLLFRLCRYLARNDVAVITDFLRQTLDSNDNSPDA